MSRTVVIHQPDFLPHLAFFERLIHADLFVILDDAQFVRGTARAWQNRDRIKTPQGVRWLTVSVGRCPLGTPINRVRLSSAVPWRRRHLVQLEESYREAAFFAETFEALRNLYASTSERLLTFNLHSIRLFLDLLGIEVEEVLASSLEASGRKSERLVSILRAVGADRYLSGIGAAAYHDPVPFEEAGIEVVWQDFQHPVYPQLHGPFVPGLSAIDAVFNCGGVAARRLLEPCR